MSDLTYSKPVSSFRLLRNIGVPALLLFLLLGLGFYQPWLWGAPDVGAMSLPELTAHRVFLVGLWLVGASFVHQLLGTLLLDGLMSRALGRPVPKLFKDILGFLCYMTALVCIVRLVLGVPLAGFLALSGVLGIVLGLALRPIILDFFSGLGANLEQAFTIGDWIAIEHAEGTHRGWIDQINWRTMRIRTRDGNILILPNSRLATSVVTNYRVPNPVSRFGIKVKLDLDTPTERALRVLTSAVNAATLGPDGPRKEPAPSVLITEASESGVEYWIRFWLDPSTRSQEEVAHAVFRCVLEHMSKAGLSFAHPQENVYLSRLPRAATGFKAVEERVRFLRQVPLFAEFTDDNLRYLAGELRLQQVPRFRPLVREGEPGQSMFLLVEGVLSVMRKGPEGGEAQEITTLNPGDFFGEISLLTGELRSATIMAATDSVVFEIGKHSLVPLLEQQPELFEALSRAMLARRETDRAADDLRQNGATDPELGRTQIFLKRMRQFFRMSGGA